MFRSLVSVIYLGLGNFILLLALIIGFSRLGNKVELLQKLVEEKLGNTWFSWARINFSCSDFQSVTDISTSSPPVPPSSQTGVTYLPSIVSTTMTENLSLEPTVSFIPQSTKFEVNSQKFSKHHLDWKDLRIY